MIEARKIILSVGSNLGDKKQNIVNCLHQIHEKIGLINTVSKLYETEAWGFESDSFFNCCLVVESNFSLKKILKKIKEIEKKLGRIKKNNTFYEARIIDIDIICSDSEILETENLKVPHPHLANRNFVLLPFLDLNYNWKHPITNETLQQIINNCNDKSSCVAIDILENSSKKIKLNLLNYIAIEGNIGAGKTTLATKIAKNFNAKMVFERFAENPFLPKFYKDQNRFAFPLEMSFLADRYQQLSDDLSQFDLFTDFVVADYHIFKSIIFAKVTLHDDEFRLYKTLFDIIYKEMPKPDLYVYLYQNTERLLENIKKRGRNYEQDIEADYLEKINLGYLDFIKSQPNLNALIIDVSSLDFVKKHEDYLYILTKIQEKLS